MHDSRPDPRTPEIGSQESVSKNSGGGSSGNSGTNVDSPNVSLNPNDYKEGSYDSSNPDFESYETSTRVCATGAERCTESIAWEGLKRFPAPDMDGKSMIRNGDHNKLTGKFWDIGPVTHVVDEKNKTLFNVTEKGHVLGHGFVKRQVVTRDDGIYIRTYKEAYSAIFNNR